MIDAKDIGRLLAQATTGALLYGAATLLGWTALSLPRAAGAALLFPVSLWALRMVVLAVRRARVEELQ